MKAVAWSALGLFAGSTGLLIGLAAWDEWQWRRIEARARRHPCLAFAHERARPPE